MEALNPSSEERIYEVLRQAGAAGLFNAALAKALQPAGKQPRQTKDAKTAAGIALRQTLARLEAGRKIVNFGTAKTPRYVLPELDRRLESACEILEDKATPGKATVYNLAALRKGHPKAVTKEIVDEAIQRLLRERSLIIIQPGKSIYYLHTRSVAPLIAVELSESGELAQTIAEAKPPGSSPKKTLSHGDFSPETVKHAYAQLVREGGFADVVISELQTRSGAPLADLQAWLLEQSRAGHASPTRGDWSLANMTARAAAIEVRGEPHLQVRLL